MFGNESVKAVNAGLLQLWFDFMWRVSDWLRLPPLLSWWAQNRSWVHQLIGTTQS